MAIHAPTTGAPSRARDSLTTSQRDTVEALVRRLEHTAAIARMLATHGDIGLDWSNVAHGIAETLQEQTAQVEAALDLGTV